MNKVIFFFIDNWKLSLVLMIFLILSGVGGLNQVRRESRPPVDFARVTITTLYPGASPEEVEELITMKIEDAIREVEGIKDVRSVSQPNRSTINVRIDMDNVETSVVVDDLQRAVQRVSDLPAEVRDPPLFQESNAKEIPILELAILGTNVGRKRDLLADDLKNKLEDQKGVAEVRLSGFRKREFLILMNPNALQRHYIGISEVTSAVRQRIPNIPAGYLRTPGNQKMVRVTGQVDQAEQLQDIVIRSNFSGQKIRVRDVATVEDGMEDPTTLVRVNGKPATLLTVTKKGEADTIRTMDGLQKELDLANSSLPEGFELIIYNDEASRIADRLGIVVNNALGGLVLVLVILLIFLPGFLGLMASLSLPFAILGSLALMPIMGVNFNNITMLALIIAIGMLVDNAVVISENYARLRLEGLDRQKAAFKAAHQFWLPLTATVLTTVAAFLPMLVTKGVMGQFIKWIPIMVTIALLMSLVEAFLLLPARLQITVLSLEKYKANQDSKGATWFDSVRDSFENFMEAAIRRRFLVFAAISGLLIGSIVVAAKFNRFELFPSEQVEYYFARFEAPITTTIENTDKWNGELADKIYDALGENEIRYIVARSGIARIGFNDPQAKNAEYVGMLTINIPREVAEGQDPQDVLKRLRAIDKGPFNTLVFDAGRNGPPVGEALNVTFRSKNNDQIKDLVKRFKADLAKVEGVVDLNDDLIRGGPELRIEPRFARVAQLGLSTQAVGNALRTALQGDIADEITLDGDELYVRVRYSDLHRAKMSAIKSTQIRQDAQGKLVPLMSLVKVSEQEGPAVRKRYNFKRAITVSAGVVPDKITSLELNQRARDLLQNYGGEYPLVTAKFGGEEESTKESMSSLKNAMLLAFLGIFIILVFLFKSFSKPFIVLSCIPLGLVGVSLSFWAHGKPLSFFALIGVVGLAGVVVNSAIVLVSYIDELQQEETLKITEALAKASAHRLRAVLVTSLTTVGGLFPTAYGLGGNDSLLVPMTLALAWGLVSGTLLTLIWVPCFYSILYDIKLILERFFIVLIRSFVSSSVFPEPKGVKSNA
jgi:multidrug efflux pump subunit AcrB